MFAANLEKAFYGFEPDFFQQNLLRIVDDVISVIKGSIELWPTLVEIWLFPEGSQGPAAGPGREPEEVSCFDHPTGQKHIPPATRGTG